MILRLAVDDPNDKATHIQVSVRHSDKKVLLSVNPVKVKDGIMSVRLSMLSKRSSWFTLAAMPRLAPKKLKAFAESVKTAVSHSAAADPACRDQVWKMIREAAAEAGVTIPAHAAIQVEEVEA